jgi:hypothetical protein
VTNRTSTVTGAAAVREDPARRGRGVDACRVEIVGELAERSLHHS